MSNGKAKGNSFERKISQDLSNWFSKGTNSDLFWRSMNSGGRATTRNKTDKKMKLHCGDIAAIDPAGESLLKVITIECKKGYNSSTFADLMDNPEGNSKYKEWIEKAEKEHKEAGSFSWILIHKRDRRIPIVIMPSELDSAMVMNDIDSPVKVFLEYNNMDFGVSTLEDFFKYVDPDKFRELGKDASGEDI